MSDSIISNDAVNVRCELAAEQVLPGFSKDVRAGVAMVVHEDCQVRNVAQYADVPYRKAGKLCFLTLADFVKAVKENGRTDATVFVNDAEAVAVFNMETWQDDTAFFKLCKTPEFLDWCKNDERVFNQAAFCDFIEDHMKEIVQPCGAELLELVTNFRQLTRVEYGSSYRGSDGQIMLEYKENKAGAGGRDMALPAEFVLHLPVIKGAEKITKYEVKARLRVRVDSESHRLVLQYKLVRIDVPQDNAVSDLVEYLRAALPAARVFAGSISARPKDMLC